MDANAVKDLVELLTGRRPTKRSGEWIGVNCFFKANHGRGDYHESAYISCTPGKRSFYHCFGCGVKLSFISAIKEYERLYKPTATSLIQNALSYEEDDMTIRLEHEDIVEYKDYTAEFNKLDKIDSFWKTFLEIKGIHEEFVYDKFFRQFGRDLVIPYFDAQGKCIGAKLRYKIPSPPKFIKYNQLFTVSTRELFYPQWDYKTPCHMDYLILVEGELDAIHFRQWGLNVLATIGTSNFSLKKRGLLLDSYFPSVILLCMDNDKAGREAEVHIKKMIGEEECFVDILRNDDGPRCFGRKEIEDVIRKLER